MGMKEMNYQQDGYGNTSVPINDLKTLLAERDSLKAENDYNRKCFYEQQAMADTLRIEIDSLKAERDALKAALETTKKHDTLEISQLQGERNLLRAEVSRLRAALKPFSEKAECETGLIVGDDPEHTMRCYECANIVSARVTLEGGGK